MGVSGCGKTTLGSALAEALVWRFVDGDTLHPPENIAKMAAGIPLQDADRLRFLERVAHAIAEQKQAGIVVACSALRRSYRDFIRGRTGEVIFVVPVVAREVLVARLAQRREHFMPPSLLDSQLDLLELPQADEQAVLLDGSCPTHIQVSQATAALRAQSKLLNLSGNDRVQH